MSTRTTTALPAAHTPTPSGGSVLLEASTTFHAPKGNGVPAFHCGTVSRASSGPRGQEPNPRFPRQTLLTSTGAQRLGDLVRDCPRVVPEHLVGSSSRLFEYWAERAPPGQVLPPTTRSRGTTAPADSEGALPSSARRAAPDVAAHSLRRRRWCGPAGGGWMLECVRSTALATSGRPGEPQRVEGLSLYGSKREG